MPCGWEGNRRSGVALAARRRLQWFIHLRDQALKKGDEHPAYNPHGYNTLYLIRPILTTVAARFVVSLPCKNGSADRDVV